MTVLSLSLAPRIGNCHFLFSFKEPVLFGSSVMENIRFGKPEATDAEVITAAKQANAHLFITSFPDGYSTVVGMVCLAFPSEGFYRT